MSAEILHSLVGPFSGISNYNQHITPLCLRDGMQAPGLVRGSTVHRYTDASWTPEGSAVGILTIVNFHGVTYATLTGHAFEAGVFTDNNQAETQGILEAGRATLRNSEQSVLIVTDSAVGIRRAERATHSAQRMRDLRDEPMSEIDSMMDELLRQQVEVQIVHTYGHSRNYGNLIADLLARETLRAGQSSQVTLTIQQLGVWIESQLLNILRGSRDPTLRNQVRNW